MRESTREIAFRFAQAVSRYDLLYVVLYGSAAKGTDGEAADLAFLVTLDTPDLDEAVLEGVGAVAAALEGECDRPLEVVFAAREFDGLDPYFVEKAFAEGVLRHARRAEVTLNGAPGRPRSILPFSLEGRTDEERTRLRRQLWGDESTPHGTGLLARLKALAVGGEVR